MMDLKFKLERNIIICAQRTTVFRYFTDSKRWASWWGEGSTIEAKPGGKVRICYPGAILALGEVLEITNNERIVFTYGYESGKPIPAGSSKITFLFRDHSEGTEVAFRHEFEDAAVRDMHVAGWRYQLALFANVVCKEQHEKYKQILAEYLNLWNTADSSSRLKMLARIVATDIRFNDPYGCANDLDDLNGHIE
ncbi:MAG TPA: SRPBCC domain-containing protein, partial [Acidobacteriota bacterium]|nr:SRPBCC domain-containing protein [Acidobacteriota bacterium]